MRSTLFSLARKFAEQIQYGFFEEKQLKYKFKTTLNIFIA